MSTPTQGLPRSATVVARAGDQRHVNARPPFACVDVAPHVRVVVVVDGFSDGGRDYRWPEELQLPAELVDAWQAAGYVCAVDEQTRTVHDVLDEFTSNGR